jgi:hypothetical protein
MSLAPGDAVCQYGGAQFQSASGVTYACNGAVGSSGQQGPKGDPGAPGPAAPRVVAKSGTGATLGLAYPLPRPANAPSPVGIYLAGANVFAAIDTATGRSVVTASVYFDQPNCTGNAFVMADAAGGWGPLYAAESVGASRLFAATSSVAVAVYSQSVIWQNPITYQPSCTTAYTSGREQGYPATEVLSYPFAAPISLALE